MDEKAENLLNELVSKIGTAEEFEQVQKQLFRRGVEALLNAELTAHLGHEKGSKPSSKNVRNGHSEKTLKTDSGKTLIRVPRDRDSSFEPVLVPKHKRSEEHTSELQSRPHLVCRLLLEKKKQ